VRDLPLYFLVIAVPLSKLWPAVGLLDDLFVAILLCLILLCQGYNVFEREKLSVGFVLVFLFFLLSIENSSGVSTLSVLLSFLFVIKLHTLIVYCSLLDGRQLRRFLRFLFVFSVAGVVFQLVFPSLHSSLLYRELSRGSLIVVLSGFQANPNYLALTMGVFIASARFGALSKVVAGVTVLMTGSRTGFVLGVASALMPLVGAVTYRKLLLVAFLLILVGVSILHFLGIFETIANDVLYFSGGINENLYIRGIMLKMSFMISSDNFPFGVGLGRFGTPYAWASDVYDFYGVSHLHFFVDRSPAVFDSNFATLLGIGGASGYLIFMCSIYAMLGGGTFIRRVCYIGLFFMISIFMPVHSNGYVALIFGLLWRVLADAEALKSSTSK